MTGCAPHDGRQRVHYPLVMKLTIRKAFAYVTHGNRLLIFSHPLAPEAGLQVPAGTMLDGEARRMRCCARPARRRG